MWKHSCGNIPVFSRFSPRMAVGGEESSAFLNEKPTLHELCEYVTIGTKWFLFGVLLKLDKRELDAIEELNKDVVYKAMKMFRLWLDTNPSATRRQVIDTLRMNTIKENAIAETYERALTEGEIL